MQSMGPLSLPPLPAILKGGGLPDLKNLMSGGSDRFCNKPVTGDLLWTFSLDCVEPICP